MKKVIFIFLILISFSNCGIGNSKQDKVNRATQNFALTIRTFINFFQDNLKNCKDFLEIWDAIIEEPQTCDNGTDGVFQVTKDMVNCENGPPINATAFFTITVNNCKDDGTDVTSTGTETLELTFTSAGNIGILITNDMLVDEFNYTFDDFETKVDLSNNNLSCSDSGDMFVDGDKCSVASNCRRCNF